MEQVSLLRDDDQTIRRANRMRLDDLDADELRDVANWINGAEPRLLEDILNDLDEEWGR